MAKFQKKRNVLDGDLPKHVFLEQVQREIQRRRMESTASYAEWLPSASPEFNWNFPHIRYIVEKLDAFTRGEIKRLMIFLPPQHGKSSAVTVRYPAYLLEKNPRTRIVVTGYGADLAETFSKQIRNLVRSRNIVDLDPDTQSIPKWMTRQGGGLKAVGVEGAITGFSADFIIIDDPVKNREAANSKAARDAAWRWFTDDLYTRQQADTPIVVIQCMTGDTPVLMEDGTEKPLREIQVGDRVATYDNGKLSSSIVLNHKNNGSDFTFKITTTSGRIVRANKRHPFLVEEEGKLKWIRLRDLTTLHKIVTVQDNGENGKENPVLSKDANEQLVQEDTVPLITAKRNGQMDTVLHQSISIQDVPHILNTDTELLPQNTTQCLQNKKENVQSVDNLQQVPTHCHIGMENSALTIATKQTRCAHSSVTTVISQLDIPKQNLMLLQSLNTCDFTTEQISKIEPDGVEDVFDIQVEDTENFIANGCVSHNTRWHEDDLSGRLLADNEFITDPQYKWQVVSLPAICEGSDPEDYYGVIEEDGTIRKREEGEALCSELHPISQLLEIQRTMGSSFAALYQQRPAPAEGDIWKKAWFCEDGDDSKPFRTVDRFPNNRKITQIWDTSLEIKQRNDPCAMVEGCLGEDGFYYIAAMVNEKMEFPALVNRMRSESERVGDNVEICVEDKANAKPARQQLRLLGIPIIEVPSGTNDKEVRAKSVSHYAESGNIRFVNQMGNINHLLIDQLLLFPNGRHDDLHDSFVHLLRRLGKRNQGWDRKTLQELASSIR